MAISAVRTQNILNNIGNFDYGPPPDIMGGGGYDTPSPTYPTQGALPRIGTYDPNEPVNMQQGTQPQSMADLMTSMYHPEHQASDEYEALLNRFPQREKPSIARRLVASGASLKGGIKAAEEVMEAPNLRNRADWVAQVAPRYNAANLERQSNINERTLAYNAATTTVGQRRADETERSNREKADIARTRAAAYDFKSRNPGLKIESPKGGYMIGVDAAGKATYITDEQGNRIKSGTLSQYDEINLRGGYQVEAAKQAGASQIATEKERQKGREALADRRGWQVLEDANGNMFAINPQPEPGKPQLVPYEPATGQGGPRVVPLPGSPSKPAPGAMNKPGTPKAAASGSELNVQRQQFTKARELYNSMPGAQSWITIQGNSFKVKQPGYWTSAADRKLVNNINAQIYGTPGGGRGGGPGTPITGGEASPLQQKAVDFLNQNGLPVTDANIQHAIKTGRVK
jgi:hypothetical protein